jgi:SAM-dependent methyltransferase
MFFSEPLRLLPKQDLVKTGPVDHADWVYQLHIGWLQTARMKLGVQLLPNRVNRLLEIGYGSGILMPELDTRANALFGIDPHEHAHEVSEKLRLNGVMAKLAQSGAEEIPFPEDHFDRVVAISSMEFVGDIHAACREIKRVLAPEGRFVVVTPGHSSLLDFGLKMLTGKNAQTDYDQRRERLLPVLREHFDIVRWVKYPPILSYVLPVYNAMELKAKTKASPKPQSPIATEKSSSEEVVNT